MPPSRDLAAHLEILQKYSLGEGLDYETIGKIAIASTLQQLEAAKASPKTRNRGIVRFKSSLSHSITLRAANGHYKDKVEVCCTCWRGKYVTLCIGDCCKPVHTE